MLSAMPPSTATYVRTPGISLRAPTLYRATPARATSDRPGSTTSRGSGRSCAPQASFRVSDIASAYSARDGAGDAAQVLHGEAAAER